MPRLLAVLVVLGVVATLATCAEKQPLRLRRTQLFGRRRDGFLGKVHEDDVYELPKDSKASSTAYFTQKLDNFNSSNQQTWRQYYWVNNAFYTSGGPIFLMIGGEGPTSSGWVSENSQVYFITLARKYNAMVFQLEHRYYGRSYPTSDMSTANLRYLSSRQALADLSNFIQAMNQQYGFQNPKWITFGGSYSGALSGWARMLYPNQILGAIATSGPVQAKVEFKEYFDVVTAALGDYKQDCVANIRTSTDQVASMLATTSGQQILRQKFKLCDDIDWNNQKNVQNFWSAIFGNFQSAVQYSEDNIGVYVDTLNRKTVCDLMTSTTITDPVDRFAAVNDLVMGVFGEGCIDMDYQSLIQYLQQNTWTVPDTSYRLWVYQTCTEFGYFQNTNTPGNPFEDKIPLSFYIDMCTDIFGSQFTNSTIFAAVDATNAFYGGRAGFNGTNVVLPNGSVDPWHALGILTSPSTDSPAVYIQGTAHCADMYPPSSRDPAGLTLARQLIDHNIGVWLGTTKKLKLV